MSEFNIDEYLNYVNLDIQKCTSSTSKGQDTDIEGLVKPFEISEYSPEIINNIIQELLEEKLDTVKDADKFIISMRKKYKITLKRNILLYAYRQYCKQNNIPEDIKLEELFKTKVFRDHSGVIVVAILTSPSPEYTKDGKLIKQDFSCEFDCHYCPKEPNQPRSYLYNEPGVRRANHNQFNAIFQIWDRFNSYTINGIKPDKIELIILGGTWHSYPEEYREEFIRDCFYASNTYYDKERNTKPREKLTIQEEHLINETCNSRIIGVTIETRPDMINTKNIVHLRKLGVTRIQLGVQSLDERILERINRRCTTKKVIKAIKLLLDNCFKIDAHLMPDLPQPYKQDLDIKELRKREIMIEDIDTDVDMREIDKEMFDRIINDEDLRFDQLKIYPCSVVPWTQLYEDYKRGLYKPYGDQMTRKDITDLHEILIDFQSKVHPWIRLNRIVRDIPETYIQGGYKDTNMRQCLDDIMKKRNIVCKCIRCREVKRNNYDPENIEMKIREYYASNGTEYFISYESKDEKILYAFLRLRLSSNAGYDLLDNVVFPELVDSALIRELHVYGAIASKDKESNVQHRGLGKNLVNKAIEISKENNYKKIAVISGIGVKNYYRKFGFENEEYFMTMML
jgi:histone acetyltransferase (RNA polymerase elongator complex component)